MSKILQALLSGLFFTLILDFFLFLSIQLNYINALEIDLYYNILFVDNQNIFIFLFLSVIIGYISLYLSTRVSLFLIGPLFILVAFTLIPPLGYSVGSLLLSQKDKTLLTKKFVYKGDVFYEGRVYIYFYDTKLEKLLKIDKNNIKELK